MLDARKADTQDLVLGEAKSFSELLDGLFGFLLWFGFFVCLVYIDSFRSVWHLFSDFFAIFTNSILLTSMCYLNFWLLIACVYVSPSELVIEYLCLISLLQVLHSGMAVCVVRLMVSSMLRCDNYSFDIPFEENLWSNYGNSTIAYFICSLLVVLFCNITTAIFCLTSLNVQEGLFDCKMVVWLEFMR